MSPLGFRWAFLVKYFGMWRFVLSAVNPTAIAQVSAIASAGFHKERYPEDTVKFARADETLRTVLGHARLENGTSGLS